MMSLVLFVLLVILLAYGVLLWRVYCTQSQRLYLSTREITTTPDQHGIAYEEVFFQAADGIRLHGWYVPCEGSRRVLLFFHGNRGNISDRLETIAMCQQLGLPVLLFDYRGYGRSEGAPSESGTYQDALAAWAWLVEQRGIAAERIVFLGRSLGAAIATWLAAQRRPGALIIESTFSSLPELAAEAYPLLPVRWLLRYQYPVLHNLQRVHCPVMVVHSREDEFIPFAHGQRLFAAANPPKEFLAIEGNHYAGYLATGKRYTAGIAGFLEKYQGLAENPG